MMPDYYKTMQVLITNFAQILTALGVVITAIGVVINGRIANANRTAIEIGNDKTDGLGKAIDGLLSGQKEETAQRETQIRVAAVTIARLEAEKEAALKANELSKSLALEKAELEAKYNALLHKVST